MRRRPRSASSAPARGERSSLPIVSTSLRCSPVRPTRATCWMISRALTASLVRPRLGRWIQRAHNAQFAVAGDTVRILPSSPGRDVDPRQLVSAIARAAAGGGVAQVELGPRNPDLTTAKAHALGIKEKLVSY